MRLAIIDLGTNSVRFDVREIKKDRPPEVIHTEKLMVRLGQGVFVSRRLDPIASRRTRESFRRFQRISTLLSVDKTVAIGTSALREARNGKSLLDAIQSETGIQVTVISGNEEAQLIAKGVMAHEGRLKRQGRLLLVDIGGGSTEIAFCRKGKPAWSVSLELGAARIQQLFLKTVPPKAAAIESARNYIREIVRANPELKKELRKKFNCPTMIGSSGTIRAVVRLLKKNFSKKKINFRDISEVALYLSELSERELRALPGLEPKRTDLILAGCLILDELMNLFGTKNLETTEFSLRDGIASEEWEIFRKSLKSRSALHQNDLIRTAGRFGQSANISARSLALTQKLVVGLGSKLKVSSEWMTLLEAAVIFRRIGLHVAFRDHSKHSAYLVRHLDLPGFQQDAREKLALLCEWHRDEETELNDKVVGLKKPEWSHFVQCLAILRVIEGIDDSAASRCEIVSVRSARGSFKIRYCVVPGHDLGVLRVDRLRKLFEKVFKTNLILERI